MFGLNSANIYMCVSTAIICNLLKPLNSGNEQLFDVGLASYCGYIVRQVIAPGVITFSPCSLNSVLI